MDMATCKPSIRHAPHAMTNHSRVLDELAFDGTEQAVRPGYFGGIQVAVAGGKFKLIQRESRVGRMLSAQRSSIENGRLFGQP